MKIGVWIALVSSLLTHALLPSAQAANTLWQVRSGNTELYLQGSVHLLKPSDYPLDPAIEQAYSACSKLIFETDLDEMQSAETMQLMLSKAHLEEGKTLKEVLNPETYKALKKPCEQVGLPLEAIQQLQPWSVATTLTLLHLQKLGLSPQHGLDHYFWKKAKEDGKTVHPLETPKFQLALFDSLSHKNQDQLILHTLDELKTIEKSFNEIKTAWEKGQLDRLNQLATDTLKQYDDLYRQMVTDRNHSWMKTFNQTLKEKETAMVIVGAAHLGGNEGLIHLLRQKGYTVTQL